MAMTDAQLRARVRELMASGYLPNELPMIQSRRVRSAASPGQPWPTSGKAADA